MTRRAVAMHSAELAGGLVPGSTDKAYSQVLDEARKSVGHKLDFSNQKDREAIGNALANYVRKTGGCKVTGDKVKGCSK